MRVVIICFALLCFNLGILTSAPVSRHLPSSKLRVLTYNILHGTNQQNEDALTSQGFAIKQIQPDLVGLQEVDNRCERSGRIDQMKKLAEITGMHAAFGAHIPYQGGEYGLGLLSRYPLSDVRTDRITLIAKDGTTETRALLSATATLDSGTTIRFATVHMGLNEPTRLAQAAEIVSHLSPQTDKVILTGDLNAEPSTEEIAILKQHFHYLPTEHTFPVGKPVKTIDYIMISKTAVEKQATAKVLTDITHSDHYPVVANIELVPGS